MSNQTILLIDYDPVSISRTTTPLIKAGYQVEVAKDGLSGLAAFERMKPVLVLVEAMLPRKHGFEVCQEIKAKPEGKSTPVLITTAVCRGRKYRMDALQIYGCDEYIEKPIADDELVSIVTRLIEEAKQAREEIGQDLSDAIDTASLDVPAAIESMDDDELEAKIDALLTGNDTSAESEKIPAAPVAQTQTAVVEETVQAPAETVAETAEAAEVGPAKIDQPAEPVVLEPDAEATALPLQTPVIAEAPAVESAADPLVSGTEPQSDSQSESTPLVERATAAPAKPEDREWTEAGSRGKKGGSKVVLFGVAAVASLGIVGFLAFQQGWIGAGTASEPAPMDVIDNASRLATHVPAPENSGLALQPPAQDIVEQESVEAATPAKKDEPDHVEAQPEPAENVPPRPVVPPPPTFKRRSTGELRAARDRQAYADQALLAAAGSLQSQLLSEAGGSSPAQEEPIEAVDLEADDLIGIPVRPKAPKARYGELFDIDDVDRAPARVRFEQPVYDELARRMHQQGEVLVEVLIDETGQVTEARLLQEIPRSRLNEASLRAARRWSYFPAVKDGVPVKVWKTERIVFELE